MREVGTSLRLVFAQRAVLLRAGGVIFRLCLFNICLRRVLLCVYFPCEAFVFGSFTRARKRVVALVLAASRQV